MTSNRNEDAEDQALLAFLAAQRDAVLSIVAGLDEEAWHRSVVPSGWTPAGLVEHLEQLGPPAEQAAVLDDLWRARTPHVAAVLEATGKAHPNAKVAKAARKAAFKLRSSGDAG